MVMDISISRYYGAEKPFEIDTALLAFELRKIQDKYLPSSEFPTDVPYSTPYPVKACIVDIETTGDVPWESRIICIGVKDVHRPDSDTIVFYHDDEETLIKQFVAWYEEQGFKEFIGYNTSFDFRFLFAACLRYRIQAPSLFKAELRDIMQELKQVYEAYVFGYNKIGTLNQWAEYLLGETKTMTYSELLEKWEDGNVESIMEYNRNDIRLENDLLLLIRFAKGEISMLPPTLELEGQAAMQGESVVITCPVCLQRQEAVKGDVGARCSACEEQLYPAQS